MSSLGQKIFLKRRRIDVWGVVLAGATMPIRIGASPLVLFLFSCIGIYLAAIQHRTARLYAAKFYLFAVLYAVWSIGLIFYREDFSLHNRQIGYVLLFTLFAFAGPGMVLVRDPIRAYVLGSRIGVIIAALATIILVLLDGGRIGIGGNAAVFAFVAAISALSATIPLRQPPLLLANGPHWLVLGIIAVFSSETRAVIVVLPLFLAIEVVMFLRRYRLTQQGAAYAVLGVVLAALVIVGPVGTLISKRFTGMIEYYDSGNSAGWKDKESADIRMAMWDGALVVIKQNPVMGVGSYTKMQKVRQAADEDGKLIKGFIHVHNTVLDELLNSGVVGFLLLMATVISILTYLWRMAANAGTKRVIGYFTLTCVSYGMLHNPLLHEATISAVFLFIAALNAGASRMMMAGRRALVENVR